MALQQQDSAAAPKVVPPPLHQSDDHLAISRVPTAAHPRSVPPPIPREESSENAAAQSTVNEAVDVAISLAQGGDVDEAAMVLQNECGDASGPAMGRAYEAVIEARLRAGDLEGACGALCEVRTRSGEGSEKCNVSPAVYEAVLRSAVQAMQHSRAVELLREMCNAGVVPSDATFNHVLDGAVRARSFGEAWDILELLLLQNRKADKYFVSILTKSLESSVDRRWVRRGIQLVDKFIEQQREDVDEIVFNSLLNVLGHVGDMLKLQQTLNKMISYNVPPSAVTYGTVVKAYGRARDIDAVIKVWTEMRQRCLGVNPVTCGCVLDACVKCGHLDKAMTIFQEMRMQGLHKNTVLYATLIKGLAKARDLTSAMALYQEMRMERVPCNLVTFNSLMDVCVRCENLQMAAVFLQDMMQLGIEPDLITFSTLIKGYSHMGEVRKALALADELKSRGLKCDEIMYNSLIDGCSKGSELQEGLRVFQDMLHSNVPPSNITFSILVKLYFEHNRMADAFRIVEEMSNTYRCAPSRVVYSVLLRCCAQTGGPALPRGAALLTDLANKRHSKLPDQGMVGTMLSGCVQHGDLDTAIQLAREFGSGKNRHGNAPVDSLRSLFEALAASGDMTRGHELLDHLRKRGLPSAHVNQIRSAMNGGGATAPLTNHTGPQSQQHFGQYWSGTHNGFYQDCYTGPQDWSAWNQHSQDYGATHYNQDYMGTPTAADFYQAAMYLGQVPNVPGGYVPPPYMQAYGNTAPLGQLPRSAGFENVVPPPMPPPMASPMPVLPSGGKENAGPKVVKGKTAPNAAAAPPAALGENAQNIQVA